MAFAVRTYLGPLFIGASGQHEAFAALEVPQVYQGSKQLGDPDDLLQLAGVVGAIASLGFRGSVDGVAPREWKGTIKPDIVIARVQAILTPEETARVELPTAKGLQHNVWDAVGIGLYTVGRYPPKRIFPA
jgi:hypothetical protein